MNATNNGECMMNRFESNIETLPNGQKVDLNDVICAYAEAYDDRPRVVIDTVVYFGNHVVYFDTDQQAIDWLEEFFSKCNPKAAIERHAEYRKEMEQKIKDGLLDF